MYQTRGLFYPSLSQRVYQSNQGLKLAAKAVCHPKGEFICLKSFWLLHDSNIDVEHNRHCFLLFLLPPSFPLHPSTPCISGTRRSSSLTPALPPLPASQRWMQLSGPGWRHTQFTSGCEMTGPARVGSILVSANSSTFAEEYEQH